MTCAADDRRVLVDSGACAHEVTWPVRLRRWWEVRRGEGWFPRSGEDGPPEPARLWARVERAFRLMDVAPGRPDPALTRRIAGGLLDEVADRLSSIADPDEAQALERAVEVVRNELQPVA